jgi:hypothetical protein
MAALNENTVWTWNAIGKRKGAWALDSDAPEATTGFLLNHLISELLPAKDEHGGHRLSNSDPVTGQAAWFDCRVRIERVPSEDHLRGRSEPAFPELPDPPRAGGGRDDNSSAKNWALSFRRKLVAAKGDKQ